MKSTIFFMLVLISFFNTSCKDEQPRNLILLTDFSSSRADMVDWYKETIKTTILENMRATDRLIVLPIDHASETAGNEIFQIDLGEIDFTNEFMGLQQDEFAQQHLHDSIKALLPRFDTAFEAANASRIGNTEGTGIISALRLAQKYVLPDRRNLVLMFSDMMEFSDPDSLNFEAHLNTKSDFEQFLQRIDPVDLSDMEFVVLTGSQRAMKSEKFTAIKLFWERYITLNNGQLVHYSSGGVSKIEELLADHGQKNSQ